MAASDTFNAFVNRVYDGLEHKVSAHALEHKPFIVRRNLSLITRGRRQVVVVVLDRECGLYGNITSYATVRFQLIPGGL